MALDIKFAHPYWRFLEGDRNRLANSDKLITVLCASGVGLSWE
jgi:hypothetical protein